MTKEHIPMTQQEIDDDQEQQRKFKLNTFGFVDQPFPRSRTPEEPVDPVNASRAKDYFMATRGCGKGELYDHLTFLKIRKGLM